MRESETLKMIVVSCIAAVIVFSLSGCGNTVSGFKTDIYEKRKAISDFVKPSETPVKEVKEVKVEKTDD
jgi:predicted small secreted protein